MYDMTNNTSVQRLLSHWVVFIENHNRTTPILLLGNKLDVVMRDEDIFVKNRIKRVANQIFRSSSVGTEFCIDLFIDSDYGLVYGC